jgi:hypothetical protein
MSAVSLLTPILTGGIQNVNFVNGRVLTAADMTAERTANLERQRLLGTCVGDGVSPSARRWCMLQQAWR